MLDRFRLCCALALASALAACAPRHDEGAEANRAGPSVAGPSDVSADRADVGPPPFLAVNAVRRPLLPLGPTMGEVAAENGCVVLKFRGAVATILWPWGTTIAADGAGWTIIQPDGKRIPLGSRATLTGAQTSAPLEGMTRLSEPLAPGCPAGLYAVTMN